MGLATVIRLEFAYPGVGVLAGDSLQYLSTATAHGVIMVFFMIMPLLFGAFGNFLLPTQLGVHDVAFPRLNSAAFWFLPGGLIMLCQLVCIDRRYQRMNCFNIRELQGILKRRFFTDLVNTSDFRQLMDTSMVGLRFKTNNNIAGTPNSFAFYNFGTTTSAKVKTSAFTSNVTVTPERSLLSKDSVHYILVSYFNVPEVTSVTSFATTLVSLPGKLYGIFSGSFIAPYNAMAALLSSSLTWYSTVQVIVFEVVTLIGHVYSASVASCYFILSSAKSVIVSNLNFPFSVNSISFGGMFSPAVSSSAPAAITPSSSDNVSPSNSFSASSAIESSDTFRFTRFNNPLIHYDYKCGNYLGMWDKLYPSLMLSFIEVARGIRKAPWFYADPITELMRSSFENFNFKFTNHGKLNLAEVDNWYSSHITPTENFFNTFYSFNNGEGYKTLR
jgi:hypothetical protein